MVSTLPTPPLPAAAGSSSPAAESLAQQVRPCSLAPPAPPPSAFHPWHAQAIWNKVECLDTLTQYGFVEPGAGISQHAKHMCAAVQAALQDASVACADSPPAAAWVQLALSQVQLRQAMANGGEVAPALAALQQSMADCVELREAAHGVLNPSDAPSALAAALSTKLCLDRGAAAQRSRARRLAACTVLLQADIAAASWTLRDSAAARAAADTALRIAGSGLLAAWLRSHERAASHLKYSVQGEGWFKHSDGSISESSQRAAVPLKNTIGYWQPADVLAAAVVHARRLLQTLQASSPPPEPAAAAAAGGGNQGVPLAQLPAGVAQVYAGWAHPTALAVPSHSELDAGRVAEPSPSKDASTTAGGAPGLALRPAAFLTSDRPFVDRPAGRQLLQLFHVARHAVQLAPQLLRETDTVTFLPVLLQTARHVAAAMREAHQSLADIARCGSVPELAWLAAVVQQHTPTWPAGNWGVAPSELAASTAPSMALAAMSNLLMARHGNNVPDLELLTAGEQAVKQAQLYPLPRPELSSTVDMPCPVWALHFVPTMVDSLRAASERSRSHLNCAGKRRSKISAECLTPHLLSSTRRCWALLLHCTLSHVLAHAQLWACSGLPSLVPLVPALLPSPCKDLAAVLRQHTQESKPGRAHAAAVIGLSLAYTARAQRLAVVQSHPDTDIVVAAGLLHTARTFLQWFGGLPASDSAIVQTSYGAGTAGSAHHGGSAASRADAPSSASHGGAASGTSAQGALTSQAGASAGTKRRRVPAGISGALGEPGANAVGNISAAAMQALTFLPAGTQLAAQAAMELATQPVLPDVPGLLHLVPEPFLRELCRSLLLLTVHSEGAPAQTTSERTHCNVIPLMHRASTLLALAQRGSQPRADSAGWAGWPTAKYMSTCLAMLQAALVSRVAASTQQPACSPAAACVPPGCSPATWACYLGVLSSGSAQLRTWALQQHMLCFQALQAGAVGDLQQVLASPLTPRVWTHVAAIACLQQAPLIACSAVQWALWSAHAPISRVAHPAPVADSLARASQHLAIAALAAPDSMVARVASDRGLDVAAVALAVLNTLCHPSVLAWLAAAASGQCCSLAAGSTAAVRVLEQRRAAQPAWYAAIAAHLSALNAELPCSFSARNADWQQRLRTSVQRVVSLLQCGVDQPSPAVAVGCR